MLSSTLCGAAAQDIVPKPASIETLCEAFAVPEYLEIRCDTPEGFPLAEYLAAELTGHHGVREAVAEFCGGFPAPGSIFLSLNGIANYPSEGYSLTVNQRGVTVEAGDYGGLFNGIQTLLQLFPADDTGWARLPGCRIGDRPRFAYRGMHLDVARTFSTKEEVMRFIDILSRHKINKFHWHLTDDEGWRIEIKSRPELATVGGFRGGDSPVDAVYGEWDKKYGGYYTQGDIREVVGFARLRNVEIIPEIDLPGHSRTAGNVYPHILCDGPIDTVATAGYDRRDVWCAAKEENFAILDDVLREVSELFPSKYIHIGGDEVVMSQWLSCPSCRALMKEKGYANGQQLQAWFMSRLEEILGRYGKSAAVWNEAINGGTLSDSTRVHGWESVQACLDATAKGYETVVMPGKYFYFDMKYSPQEPGMTWAGIVPTDTVYTFDFGTLGFGEEHMKNVVGVQGAFWSEIYLSQDRDYLYRMSYPRVCALAEVAWSPEEGRDLEDFNTRLERSHYRRLENLGVDYRREPPAQEEVTLLTPAMTFESSMKALAKNPFAVLTSYRYGSSARTTRTCKPDDYFSFTFDEPVDCARIEFATGYAYLKRCLIPFGYVEVAYGDDPDTYIKYGELSGGGIMVEPEKPVKSLRIISTTTRNGESSVIIQPLRIIAK